MSDGRFCACRSSVGLAALLIMTAPGCGSRETAAPGSTVSEGAGAKAEYAAAVAAIKATGGDVSLDAQGEPLAVTLTGDQVDDELFSQIAGMHGLLQLYVTKSAITDGAMSALDGMRELRLLNLYDNQGVTDAGLAHIAGLTSLKKVILSSQPISDAGLAHLSALPNLEELQITSDQVHGDGLQHLAGDRELVTLWLSGGSLNGDGLQHLAQLPKLEELHLDGPQITDASLQHLSGQPTIKTLFLSKTQVGDEGLVHLKGLPQLESLMLDGTQVTDAGLEHLTGIPTLKAVNLVDTRVSMDAARKFIDEHPAIGVSYVFPR